MDIIEIIFNAYSGKKINKHSKIYKKSYEIVDIEEKLLSSFDETQKKLYFKFDTLTSDLHFMQEIELIKFYLQFYNNLFSNKI
ncbi:MAG: hypothetical protein ACI4T1_01460 [Christensenellales bacterium]